MIGRLRELAARPIADRARGRLLACAVAAILAATALSLATRPHRTDTAPVSTRPATPTTPVTAAPAPRQPAGAPAAVVRTARAFFAGYLAFLYGHRGAQAITGATPALRHYLASRVLVVPPAQRRLHGHAIDLTATVAGGGWSVRALIADGGVADYPIVLELARAGGRWLVSGVGG